jgi:hypothetical protein
VFSLIPGESSAQRGLRFELYWEKLRQAFELEGIDPRSLLPKDIEPWDGRSSNPSASGYTGYFRSEAEASRFADELAKRQKG